MSYSKNKKNRSEQVLRINNLDAPAYAIVKKTKEILHLQNKGMMKKPRYQRKPVWDTKPKMKPDFITTILDGQLIVPCTLQETPSGTFQMLNCQQRFNTIQAFAKNKFAIPKSVDAERAGLKYQTLTPEEQRNFMNYEFLLQVQVSKNGKGRVAYKKAQLGFHHSKAEVLRADYYNTSFYKLIQTQLKKPLFKDFFNESGVLTRNAIARCEDEEFMGECLLLEAFGACEGTVLKQMLDEFSRKPFGNKKFNDFKNRKPEYYLHKHIQIVNRIFPKGLALKEDTTGKLTKKQRNTRLGNKTAFYRLLGAIKMIDAIHGVKDQTLLWSKIFTDAKCKKIRQNLPEFATKSGADGRAGKAEGKYQRYYASTTRATTNKAIRQIGIEIIKDLIISY